MENKYYVIELVLTNDDAYLETLEDYGDSLIDLIQGKSLSQHPPKLLLTNRNKNRRLTDLLGINSFFVVSSAMRTLLERKVNGNLEFFEVQIEPGKKGINQCYSVVNILDNLDCFDPDNSVYTRYPSGTGIRTLTTLSLKTKAIGNRAMFRITYLEPYIFVSEAIKNSIEEAKFSGIGFVPIEKFTKGRL